MPYTYLITHMHSGKQYYGLNDEQICFDCGMKDVATTKRKMDKYIFGESDEE